MRLFLLALAVTGTLAHDDGPDEGQVRTLHRHDHHDDDDDTHIAGWDKLVKACKGSVKDLCEEPLKDGSRLHLLSCLNRQQERVESRCLDTINRFPIRAQFECAPDIVVTCPREMQRETCIRDNFSEFSASCQTVASEEWTLEQGNYGGSEYSWLAEDSLPEHGHHWFAHVLVASFLICCVCGCIRRRRNRKRRCAAMAAQQVPAATLCANCGHNPQHAVQINAQPMQVQIAVPFQQMAAQPPATQAVPGGLQYAPPVQEPRSPAAMGYVMAQPVASYPSLGRTPSYQPLESIQ